LVKAEQERWFAFLLEINLSVTGEVSPSVLAVEEQVEPFQLQAAVACWGRAARRL
jgi:hypothetical protein